MERDPKLFFLVRVQCHFNSHAHVERDYIEMFSRIAENISTHTLTWSVTHFFADVGLYVAISTHTLTWSVTEKTSAGIELSAISTHTLTWSVTGYR